MEVGVFLLLLSFLFLFFLRRRILFEFFSFHFRVKRNRSHAFVCELFHPSSLFECRWISRNGYLIHNTKWRKKDIDRNELDGIASNWNEWMMMEMLKNSRKRRVQFGSNIKTAQCLNPCGKFAILFSNSQEHYTRSDSWFSVLSLKSMLNANKHIIKFHRSCELRSLCATACVWCIQSG